MANLLPPGLIFPSAPPQPPSPPWRPPRSPTDNNPGGVIAGVSIGVGIMLFLVSCMCSLARNHRRSGAGGNAAAHAAAIPAARPSAPPEPADLWGSDDQQLRWGWAHDDPQLRGARDDGRRRPRRASPAADLPSFAYNGSVAHNVTGSGSGDEAAAATCSVCLGAFQAGETVRLLPVCLHLYHVECIDPWLDAHSTCPICRSRTDLPMDGGLLPPV